MFLHNYTASVLFWPAATIALYAVARLVYRVRSRWWLSPIIPTTALLLVLALTLNTGYDDYIRGTHWLVVMLGPVTVAFALPIYEQRAIIRRYWPLLTVGVFIGSGIAMTSAWGMATILGLSGPMRLSLLPRSISTPFAMTVSGDIGGIPELTAIFVVITGVAGAAIGEAMLYWLPLRSSLARGALFGMGAQSAGVAKAHEIGGPEGSIAGLVMILAGLFNVLVSPLLALGLR